MTSAMTSGTEALPIQIAIVGSGPSGFYAAEALLKGRPDIQIDMYDKLPTPFGLVRGGVAPDHPKIKMVCAVYDKIARNPRFAFLGNVEVGRELPIDRLREAYHAVILACGASSDRRLGIPGEDLPGSHTATEFVGWYNAHPDFRECRFDFSCDTAVVIGHGNVAADVARILATPVDLLAKTDIAEHALEELSRSRVRDIHVVGRRGPAQAKFTAVELKELGAISGCSAQVAEADLVLNAESEVEIASTRGEENRKNMALFRAFASAPAVDGARRLHFRFLETPVAIEGNGKAQSLLLARNELRGAAFEQVAVASGEQSSLPCGLVFRSVGYRGMPLPGTAFDEQSGTIPNYKGRCVNGSQPEPGLYVTGWIKRGPSGLIGTNRADSVETVASLLEDLNAAAALAKPGAAKVRKFLAASGSRITGYSEWDVIDAAEKSRGAAKGKPREKFTKIPEMLECL